MALFKNNGYEVLGHFTLPVSSWFEPIMIPCRSGSMS